MAPVLKTCAPEPAYSVVAEQLEIARGVLQMESTALAEVSRRLDERFANALSLIHESQGSVVVTGIGKAGLVGQKIAATFASTGTRAQFVHLAEAVHGDLGRISDSDVVLALSHSGETEELVRILGPIRALGVPLIGITSRANSALARACRVAIVYGDVREACPVGLAPSTSCVVMMAIGDALAFALMRMRDFGKEDFGRFHPGGSLGRRLRTVDDIMRTGPQLRIAPSHLSVREVFVRVARPGRRTGAILLIDEQGALDGLFTDSDLARLVERREFAAFEGPIAEVMTRRPLSIRRGQRVWEVLDLLRNHHVSEVPVLDEGGRPVGIIDITDLVDLMPEAA